MATVLLSSDDISTAIAIPGWHFMNTFHQLIQRIIEWFWLQGTLKIIYFLPHCHGEGCRGIDHLAQNLIQTGLGHFQG